MKLKKFELVLICAAVLSAALCTGFFVGRKSLHNVSINITSAPVPERGGIIDLQANDGAFTDLAGLVNINTASVDELVTLPGIGEVIAGRIIEYREENGSFASKEDIKNVYGIGETIYKRLSGLITVE